MKCCVCGTELKFIEYGTKIGKNGQPAKWPIYEKCPNKANHRAAVREAVPAEPPQGRPERKPVVIEVPDGTPVSGGPKIGMGFYWTANEIPDSYEVKEAVNRYLSRVGKAPVAARCNLKHYPKIAAAIAEAGLALDLSVDLTFRAEWPRLDLDL